MIANDILGNCHKSNQSYIYLYIDGGEEKFAQPIEIIGEKRVLTIFRNKAPIPGTSCQLDYAPVSDTKRNELNMNVEIAMVMADCVAKGA